MAEFTTDFQSFRPSFPLSDIDPSLELLTQFTGMNPFVHLDNNNINNNSNLNYFHSLIPFSQEPDFPGNLEENFTIFPREIETNDAKKRKANMDAHGDTSSAASESGSKMKISYGRGKRVKNNEAEEGKTKEVVHVRARRGQATDSHSLAERVRRGKINEKIRCLQNIVPGCYKTMGMAVMLDEIINYVQSLQHQVEFLSMKLTAASTFYDFNSETDALETMQRAKASEAKELSKHAREGYGCFQPTWPL